LRCTAVKIVDTEVLIITNPVREGLAGLRIEYFWHRVGFYYGVTLGGGVKTPPPPENTAW
jgi:hypothetical protein